MMRFRPKIAFLLAAGMLALVLACFWLWFTRDVSEPMPVPNGHHDFLAAAKALKGHRYAYGEFAPDEARQFVQENQEAFNCYREGLKKESRIPIEYSTAWTDSSLKEMAQIKRLVHSILTEARVIEDRGESVRAFRFYCDALRFAYQIPRGGLWFHYQAAQAYKLLVFKAIQTAVLTAAQRQELLGLLNKLEEEQETLKSIALRERYWHRRTGTFKTSELLSAMIRLGTFYPEKAGMEVPLARFQMRLATFRERLVDPLSATGVND